jgi:hypothetical protein
MADAALEGKAMRKDMPEEEMATVMRASVASADEVELSDEELLGEATLAKITTKSRLAEFEEEVVAVAEFEEEADAVAEFEEEIEAEEEIEEEELAFDEAEDEIAANEGDEA